MKIKTNGHGGARPGAGPKLKFKKKMITISTRIPEERKQEFRDAVKALKDQWKRESQ